MKALDDYTRQSDGELSFSKGALFIAITYVLDRTLVGCNGVYGWVPSNHIEITGRSRPDGSVTNRDRVLIGGTASYVEPRRESMLARRGDFIDMWPPEVYPLPDVTDGGQQALNEAPSVIGARIDAAEAKRAQLLQGLCNAGVSRLEADQVVALYLQQSTSSPPALPPRLTVDVYESSTTAHSVRDPEPSITVHSVKDLEPSITLRLVKDLEPSTTLGSDKAPDLFRILIFDDANRFSSIVAQCYLEMFRVMDAMAGVSWLFDRVSCTTMINEDLGSGFSSGVGSNGCNDAEMKSGIEKTTLVAPTPLIKALSAMFDLYPRRSGDHQVEANIIERVQLGGREILPVNFLDHYDFFLTFDTEKFDSHVRELLRYQRVPSSTRIPRGILLPESKVDKKNFNFGLFFHDPLLLALKKFLRHHFGWKDPSLSLLRFKGPLEVVFVQLQDKAQVDRVVENHNARMRKIKRRELRKIEKLTRCITHVARQSDGCNYGWVIAIVGRKEQVRNAEVMVQTLKDGRTLDFR